MSRFCRLFAGALLFGIAPLAGAQSGTAVLTGSVLVDSVRTPIEGAEVLLPALSKRAQTTGNGRFRIEGIPAGIHEVVVRYVGFTPLALEIAFAADSTVDRPFLLRRVTTLDPVAVESSVIPSFDEHRALGLGTFFTRSDIAKLEQMRLSEIIAKARGVRVQNTGGGRAFIYSGRRASSSIDPRGTKGSFDRFVDENKATGGNVFLCYALVYLNNMLVYRGGESEQLFDINSVTPNQVEAIEYYSGPGSTPLKYSRLNSPCGVVVIHTRRVPDKPKQ